MLFNQVLGWGDPLIIGYTDLHLKSECYPRLSDYNSLIWVVRSTSHT